MIETTMELVDGRGEGIVPIHEIGMDDGPDGLFTRAADVSDSVRTGPLLGNLVFLVIEPLQGLERLIEIRASPITEVRPRSCWVSNGACANTDCRHWRW